MTQTLAFRARLRGYIDSQWDLNLGEFRDADDNPVDLSSRSFVGEARATADGADVLVTLAVTGTVNGALRLQSPNADNKGLSVGEAAFSVMETTGGSWELVGTGSIDLRKHATRSTGDFSAFTDIGGGLRILFAEAIGDSKLIMRGRDGITLPEVTSVYDDTITARDKSQDWAEKAEDSEVETGKYSALHHSAKALGQRVLAETAKTDAQAVTVSIVETTETVGGSSKTNTLEVTAPYTNTSYANPFTGWGEIYNPAGISFNCIRPRIISRRASLTTDADKWERINVVVRTGATPHLSGSTVLAVGDIKVKPDDDILYDLEILLTDSISGLVKTLTDADMIDSKYFIAVWASRADGGVAYMSPHTGTLPNTAGTSWYMSAGGDAVNDSYAVFTGNWRLGVDHVLVADPEKVTTYTPQDAFKDDILGDTLGITDYGFDIDEGVSADGESVTLAMTGGQSSGVRDLPFSGWGETYTANGVSFNAIRAKIIGRALNIPASSKWERIHAVVRTGAIPGGTENTVLAIGSVRVRKTSDTLTDVTVVLKDPVTGDIVTIDDSDYIGGKYFIGLYARTLLGGFAAMAEHFGTLPNGETSYYTTTGEPINGAWALNSGNSRLGVEHLLLTNPVTTVNYNATDEFKNDVNDVVSAQNWAPPKMYAVEGLETSVYFDNLIAGDYDDYHWSVSGLSKGIQQNERWMLNLDAADIGGGTQSITVYQKGTESALFTKNIELEAALASAGTGVTVNYMMIGDSLTASGVITSTLLALASSDPLTINMVGIRGSGSNLHEGRSGWTIGNYAGPGPDYYLFTVSGITVEPIKGYSEFTHNSSTYRVQDVDLVSGSGTIECQRVSGASPPASSGTLTKSFGTGDATIAFSSYVLDPGNPMWIGGQLDFGQYLIDEGLTTPNWVGIMLGTNDVFGQTSDAGATTVSNTAFDNLDIIIASIKAADANVKIAIIPVPPPSNDQDAFGDNYKVSYQRWRVQRNYIIWNKKLSNRYSGEEGNRVYICPAGLNVDSVNGFPRAAAANVNSRSTVQVERQSNGVHVATSGYQQIADGIFAFLKNQV